MNVYQNTKFLSSTNNFVRVMKQSFSSTTDDKFNKIKELVISKHRLTQRYLADVVGIFKSFGLIPKNIEAEEMLSTTDNDLSC